VGGWGGKLAYSLSYGVDTCKGKNKNTLLNGVEERVNYVWRRRLRTLTLLSPLGSRE